MEVYQAIILGIVQGLTELLPISSSAHLKLIPWIFNWSIPESFDVALHLGTLLAITLFFFKDWLGLIKGGYEQVVNKKKSTEVNKYLKELEEVELIKVDKQNIFVYDVLS